jgi:hypothetical protein
MDMQRRDLLACCCLLVLSLLACGCMQAGGEEAQPTPTPAPPPQVGSDIPQPVPTPPGQWDGKKPYDVKFVDPATYHITPTVTPTITMVKQPNDLQVETRMKDYAMISSKNASGVMATEVYHIPFPYWELNYTATGYNSEGARLKIEIRDANDPNRPVGEVKLGRADFKSPTNTTVNNSTAKENTCSGTLLLREGFRDYYFVIYPESLRSFDVVIRAPANYMI